MLSYFVSCLSHVNAKAKTSVYALFPGLIVVTLKTHDVYSQVSEMFSPYFKYCAEQTACQQYCKDQDRDNQVFKAYLAVRSSLYPHHFCPDLKNDCCSGAKLNETAIVCV